LTKLNNS